MIIIVNIIINIDGSNNNTKNNINNNNINNNNNNASMDNMSVLTEANRSNSYDYCDDIEKN